MELTIKNADNGYVASWWEDNAEGQLEQHRIVCEETNSAEGDLVAMKKLLLTAKEYFAVYGSEYDEWNLRVVIVNKEGVEYEQA